MTRTPVRVRYPETDRMKIAWHGHFFAWFELGRTELMRELGCPYGVLEERDGIFFPVREASARYRASARYDDELTVRTRIASVGGASVRFEYEIVRDEDRRLLATGFSVHAAVDGDGRPRRLPGDLVERLRGSESQG